MHLIKGLFIFLSLITVLACPAWVRASGSGHGGSRGHKSVPMAHTGYRSGATSTTPRSGSGSSPTSGHSNSSVSYSGSHKTDAPANSSKAYHPGVTHGGTSGYGVHSTASEQSAEAHRVSERRKVETAKKKSQPTEIKSANRLISPPKPKTKKPSGPFDTK